LHLTDPKNGQTTEIAFRDARRLGRIRLCSSPHNEPPISELGFDPLLSMPTFSDFSALLQKRKGIAVKALLLDQTFSAGVGNWIAGANLQLICFNITVWKRHGFSDEVLYHARIHPEQKCNTLSQEQLQTLHEKITYVCLTATSVNADDSQFPENWLFKYRWVRFFWIHKICISLNQAREKVARKRSSRL
jgi:formamidopyrimidine-DNA glycosylase